MTTIEKLLLFGILSNIIGWLVNFFHIQKMLSYHERQMEISETYLERHREERRKDTIL